MPPKLRPRPARPPPKPVQVDPPSPEPMRVSRRRVSDEEDDDPDYVPEVPPMRRDPPAQVAPKHLQGRRLASNQTLFTCVDEQVERDMQVLAPNGWTEDGPAPAPALPCPAPSPLPRRGGPTTVEIVQQRLRQSRLLAFIRNNFFLIKVAIVSLLITYISYPWHADVRPGALERAIILGQMFVGSFLFLSVMAWGLVRRPWPTVGASIALAITTSVWLPYLQHYVVRPILGMGCRCFAGLGATEGVMCEGYR